jgi:hypothetical protein
MKKAHEHSTHPVFSGVLATLEEAAAALFIDAAELRDHCDRQAHRCGDIALVRLEAGITGFRTRGAWRFRFPMLEANPGGPDGPHASPTGDGQ